MEQHARAYIAPLLGVLSIAAGSQARIATDGGSWYAKEATWLETMIASREKLMKEAGIVASSPTRIAKSVPATIMITNSMESIREGRKQQVPVKIDVSGVKDIYISGELENFYTRAKTAYGRNDLSKFHFSDAGGRKLGPARPGKVEKKKGRKPKPTEIPIPVPPGAKYLEGTAVIGHSRTLLCIDTKRISRKYKDYGLAVENLLDFLYRDFPDRESIRQIITEAHAGVWTQDWRDVGEIAERYAERCPEKLKGQARALAARVKDVKGLESVRAFYYRGLVPGRMELAEKTLAYVEKSARRPELASKLRKTAAAIRSARRGLGRHPCRALQATPADHTEPPGA